MTKTELLDLIANGESSGVEFKRDDVRPKQLAKEVVALANLQGGVILLGVEDDGSISGIQRENLEVWVMDTVFGRYVHPMILPFYETMKVDDEHRVAVISLTQGTAKPYVGFLAKTVKSALRKLLRVEPGNLPGGDVFSEFRKVDRRDQRTLTMARRLFGSKSQSRGRSYPSAKLDPFIFLKARP